MTSGVPLGSVLGPLLFDDLDEDIVSKFADGNKIGGVMNDEEDYLRLQQDPD